MQSSFTELARSNFHELMKTVATSIPGHVLSFDPATQLAQIQIGIVRKDVNGVEFTPPPLIEVIVHFAGGDYSIEHQIDPLNEGIILFSQRCVDGWKTTGGVAKNPIMRFHDIQDAAFLPGLRSQPNALSSFENNGIRLRNKNASHYAWLKNDGTIELKNDLGLMTMLPDGSVNINGAIISPVGAITSPVSVGAPTVVAATSLTVVGVEQAAHVHLPGAYNISEAPVTGNSGVTP